MDDTEAAQRFERIILPHLGASYNLARWLLHNAADAEDVVQEAYLRALRSFDGYRGGDPRAWLLTIVRNTCYTWLRKNRGPEFSRGDDTDASAEKLPDDPATRPEALLLRDCDAQLLRRAFEALPVEFREAMVLRELEGLSYKEIAAVTGVALGTVMSRLARARTQLRRYLLERNKDGA